MTIKELSAKKGEIWSDAPGSDLNITQELLWRVAKELAAFLELYATAEEMLEVAPEAAGDIWETSAYFAVLGQPRPHSVALVALRLERHEAGLADE